MKIARLLLEAFGPFTENELTFLATGEDTAPELHLIHGPNEAGKSSALRAITDLRFGIPQQTPDRFLHDYGRLRIKGVFLDDRGQRRGLARHKGREPTLTRFDEVSGETLPSDQSLGTLERALTGGLSREEFEILFGLNHERLRRGGERLLRGEGELGAALFEASAGTRGIGEILKEIKADAKKLFNPHGRAQSRINQASRELSAQRALLLQAQIRPKTWEDHQRAYFQASERLAEIERRLEAQRRRDLELAELRTVQPLLREHDRLLEALETLRNVPDLPAEARDRRLRAEQERAHARAAAVRAGEKRAHCGEALEALRIETGVLKHAVAIERLHAALEPTTRARFEGARAEARRAQVWRELSWECARIAPGRTVEEVVAALPSAADGADLEQKLRDIGVLRERLEGYRSRRQALDREARGERGPEIPRPPAAVCRQLSAARQQAQALGDSDRRLAEDDQTIADWSARLQQGLADLPVASLAVLRQARPLSEPQIQAARQAYREWEEEGERWRAEQRRNALELEEQRQIQQHLSAQGEVVTIHTLQATRARRDQDWMRMRERYIAADSAPEKTAPTRATFQSLAAAFEQAQAEADRQADLLRADSRRAASIEDALKRLAIGEARERALADEHKALAARHARLRSDWSRRLAQAGLPELEPEVLRDWQNRREQWLELAWRLEEAIRKRDREARLLETAIRDLNEALAAAGETPVTGPLKARIDQAARWEKAVTEAATRHQMGEERRRLQAREQAQLGAAIADAETVLEGHQVAVAAWHARLFLDADVGPEAVQARLGELKTLARRHADWIQVCADQAEQETTVATFAAQAGELAALLGETPGAAVEDFADRAKARLEIARDQLQQQRILERDRQEALLEQSRAEKMQAYQEEALATLSTAAGAESLGQLAILEEQAAGKRQLRQALQAQQAQLAQASSRPLAALRAALADQDTLTLERERQRSREAVRSLQEEQSQALEVREQTKRALDAIDSSDAAAVAREAMESAAATYRAAVHPWARLTLAQALLDEALTRFRDRAQAPMVAAASRYFALISGGRYPRLVTDDGDNGPVLKAEREDGRLIGTTAMSDGTRDQLYLALRLGALELRREVQPPMPLVLDDVLITTDERRAANILQALARFAEGRQTLLFTHQHHLVGLARRTLDERQVRIHQLP